jgi:hypothetical protein
MRCAHAKGWQPAAPIARLHPDQVPAAHPHGYLARLPEQEHAQRPTRQIRIFSSPPGHAWPFSRAGRLCVPIPGLPDRPQDRGPLAARSPTRRSPRRPGPLERELCRTGAVRLPGMDARHEADPRPGIQNCLCGRIERRSPIACALSVGSFLCQRSANCEDRSCECAREICHPYVDYPADASAS